MSQTKFNVVYKGGIVSGFSLDQVKENFAKRFSLSEEKLNAILAKDRFVFKRNVDKESGEKYLRVFRSIGIETELEAIPESLQTTNKNTGDIPGNQSDQTSQENATPQREGSAATSLGQPREVEFRFNGSGGEYFKIWIVNILLTIVTLGFYSAWAKVRNKRYFYGNTEIDGSSFEYLATPMAIFKGRMLASVVFLVYYLVSQFNPIAGLVLSVVFLFLIPWAIVRSFAFNAINSAYRNVRFRFEGTYVSALLVFVVFPALALVTAGLLAPFAYYKQIQFFYNGHRFGTCPFKSEVSVKDVYMMFLIVLGISIGVALVLGVFVYAVPFLAVVVGLLFYLCLFVIFTVRSTNLRYNYLGLGQNGFTAAFDMRSYGTLFVTNTLGIVLTLGLFTPWAKVRTAKYKANRIGYLAVTDTNAFVEDQQEQVKAIGEEFAEMFDWDFGF